MLGSYAFKTTPYACQSEALALSADKPAFALLMEQGTGKSKVIVDTAGYQFEKGAIQGVVVIAPNSVHRNWARQQVPFHLPDRIPRRCAWWSSTPKKEEKAAMDALMAPGNFLRVFTINYEALATNVNAVKWLTNFLKKFDCIVVCDESHRIKNPSAKTTKEVLKLRRWAKFLRILTGTPVANSPLDVYSQFYFLDPTILRQTSHTAFRARYAEIMPETHPLVQAIKQKTGAKFAPTMIATDASGKPIYKNLDELRALTAPHSFRVLKKDCLDLPDKVFVRRAVELHPDQLKYYRQLSDALRTGLLMGEALNTPLSKLTAILHFQQILCGIIPPPIDVEGKGFIFEKPELNPRVRAMLDDMEESDEQMIIWARFTYDINCIHDALARRYGEDSVRKFNGQTPIPERSIIEDDFQCGKRRFIVGNATAGGTGLTLTAATQTHYYSNSFKLIDRLQSEDRVHRIGQLRTVRYVDYEVERSVDSRILKAFVDKKDVADAITGDDFMEWIKL